MKAQAVLLACIAVALVLGALARSAAGTAPTFAVSRNYAVGQIPGSVSLGDLNADGAPDVVTTDPYGPVGNKLTVLLNRGDGNLRRPQEYTIGLRSWSSAEVRDLDGNGSLDLVTANHASNSVSVLLNRGDGTFASARGYGTGKGPEELTVGDLNTDGRPDLVTASFDQKTISVLLNVGNGTFLAKRDYPTGKVPDGSPSVGDLNGDGSPDLATPELGGISVFLNNGDGTFEGKRAYRWRRSGSLAIADLNRDGKPDLVTSDGPGISVLLNRGGGSFRARRHYRARWSQELAVADLNRDAKPDLVANREDGTSILLNHANGTFMASHDYRAPECPDRTDACAFQQVAVRVRDVNQDAAPDFMSVNPGSGRNAVYLWLNRGNGTFERLGYGKANRPVSFAIADLDGDQKQDVVTANFGSKTVAVLLNRPVCNVQDVRGMSSEAARRTLARVKCRVGKVQHAASRIKAGLVISQKPKFGVVLPGGGKVSLVVSGGRR